MAQILTWWRALLEIFLLAILIYAVLAFLRGSRGAGILRGLGAVLGYLVIALIVIFQPELRRALVRVGESPVFTRFIRERWDASDQIATAVLTMSHERTGALLALQRTVGLKTYSETGVRLDAEVSAELLVSIFRRGGPLHDGAVIIRAGRIIAAASLFPLSDSPSLHSDLGTRHRAAVGITEETDAVAIVVSEETGSISVAQNGVLNRNVNEKTLREILHAVSSEEGFQAAPIEGLS